MAGGRRARVPVDAGLVKVDDLVLVGRDELLAGGEEYVVSGFARVGEYRFVFGVTRRDQIDVPRLILIHVGCRLMS